LWFRREILSFLLKEANMALDDFMEPEVAVAVAVTAAVASPPVRRVLRRGVVYGLAGLLMAGEKISAAARGIAHGAQQAAAQARSDNQETEQGPPPRVITT
jgi:hypothetical protein